MNLHLSGKYRATSVCILKYIRSARWLTNFFPLFFLLSFFFSFFPPPPPLSLSSGLWKYKAASIQSNQEMKDVSALLIRNRATRAYIGAKQQWSGDPQWVWEDGTPVTDSRNVRGSGDWDSHGDATKMNFWSAGHGPVNRQNQNTETAHRSSRITVTQGTTKAWEDTYTGVERLPMVCRRQHANIHFPGAESRPAQWDSNKQCNKDWAYVGEYTTADEKGASECLEQCRGFVCGSGSGIQCLTGPTAKVCSNGNTGCRTYLQANGQVACIYGLGYSGQGCYRCGDGYSTSTLEQLGSGPIWSWRGDLPTDHEHEAEHKIDEGLTNTDPLTLTKSLMKNHEYQEVIIDVNVRDWTLSFEGECSGGGSKLRMYQPNSFTAGLSDSNPGTNLDERIHACGVACRDKKKPMNSATWTDSFGEALGFLIRDDGFCECETVDSSTCTKVTTSSSSTRVWRYDFYTKEANEMWVEIFSDSHPQAVVRVGEMEVYVRRYDRVTSWYKKTGQRHTRNNNCFRSNYVEDVTPEDCWAVRRGLNNVRDWDNSGYYNRQNVIPGENSIRGCYFKHTGTNPNTIRFNGKQTSQKHEDIYSGPICKKYVRERLPTTYRPWLTRSETSRWKIAPRYVAVEKTDYNGVDLHIRPVQNVSSSFPAGSVSSQVVLLNRIMSGTIEISYTLVRERKGTCNMKYNMPLSPTTTGIKSQSNQSTKEDCALWCEDDTETTAGCKYENGVCFEMNGPIEEQTLGISQTPFVTTKQEQTVETSNQIDIPIPKGTISMWIKLDCTTGAASHRKNGIIRFKNAAGDIMYTGPSPAEYCDTAAEAPDVNEFDKDLTVPVLKTATTLVLWAEGASGGTHGPVHFSWKFTVLDAWACWMHQSDDQKIHMGMTTASAGGKDCKSSDMLDLLRQSEECRQSGFVLEHTLKGRTRRGLYDQSASQRQTKHTETTSHYDDGNHVLRGDLMYRLREKLQQTYAEPFIMYSGDDVNVPDHGPYRVTVVRNGIDGSVTIKINGIELEKQNFLAAGTKSLQIWFQVNGRSSFRVENILMSERPLGKFVDYAYASWSLPHDYATQFSQMSITFANLKLSNDDGADHLLVISRTPPWQIIESFQLINLGCPNTYELRHCTQCGDDGNCRLCNNGMYLHGGICLVTCPAGTSIFTLDDSSSYSLEDRTIANNKGYSMSEMRRATPLDCATGRESTKLGMPIMKDPASAYGTNPSFTLFNRQACAAFDGDKETSFWTSNSNVDVPSSEKWIGYHFNESKKIVAYTLTIRQSSTNDVPGQWVVEGANDKNADNVLTAYEDRSIDRTGWVVLDSSNMFESMYTMNDNDWIPFSSKYPRISGTGKLDFDYAKGDLLEELSITQGQISKLSQQNVGYAFDTHLIHEGIETTVQWTVDQDYNPSGQQYSNHKMIGFSHGYNKGDNKNGIKYGLEAMSQAPGRSSDVKVLETNSLKKSSVGMFGHNSETVFEIKMRADGHVEYRFYPVIQYGTSSMDTSTAWYVSAEPNTEWPMYVAATIQYGTISNIEYVNPTTVNARTKTFHLPRSSLGFFHRYRLRFLSSSTDNLPDWKQDIYELMLLESKTESKMDGAMTGRACLGMSDKDPRHQRMRGIVTFDASRVNMSTKYDPAPTLHWGRSSVDLLEKKLSLKKFQLPSNGLLRTKLPSVKRPASASHLIAMNNDGSWIGSVEIVDVGCNLKDNHRSTLSNCARCDRSFRCLSCTNGTYLNDGACVEKCTHGRLPMGSGSAGGWYCAGLSDWSQKWGLLEGKIVVPNAPCKMNMTYVGVCSENTMSCPLLRIKTGARCSYECEIDFKCIATTYDLETGRCWLWGRVDEERVISLGEGGATYTSCPSTRQRRLLSDQSRVTALWDDAPWTAPTRGSAVVGVVGSTFTSFNAARHPEKECATFTSSLRGGSYNIGDRVVTKYPNYQGLADDPWFTGVITAFVGNTVSITYDDGDTATGVTRIYKAPNSPFNSVGKGSHRFNDMLDVLSSYSVTEQFAMYDLAIGTREVHTLSDCSALCTQDRACDGITYHEIAKECILLHGCADVQVPYGGNPSSIAVVSTYGTVVDTWTTNTIAWNDRTYHVTDFGEFTTSNYRYFVQCSVSNRATSFTLTSMFPARYVVITENAMDSSITNSKPCPSAWKKAAAGSETNFNQIGYIQHNLAGHASLSSRSYSYSTHCSYVDVPSGGVLTVPPGGDKKFIFVTAAPGLLTILASSRTAMCTWNTVPRSTCSDGGGSALLTRGAIGPDSCRLLCAAKPEKCQCYSVRTKDGACSLSQTSTTTTVSDDDHSAYTKGLCDEGAYDGSADILAPRIFPRVPLTVPTRDLCRLQTKVTRVGATSGSRKYVDGCEGISLPQTFASRHVKGDYLASSWNDNVCPTRSTSIQTAVECEIAATSMVVSWKGTVTDATSPSGCFWKKLSSPSSFTSSDGLYFNNPNSWSQLHASAYCNHNPPGAQNSGTQSIVLDNTSAASIAACKQQCEETSNCHFITFDHSGGDCRTYQTCTGTPRLYSHGSYESHELTRATGSPKMDCRQVCIADAPLGGRSDEEDKSNALATITLHLPLLEIPMRNRTELEKQGVVAAAAAAAAAASNNPKQITIVVDQSNVNDTTWNIGAAIYRYPLHDAGCMIGCGRCDATDHCVECHDSYYLSGGTCVRQCALNREVREREPLVAGKAGGHGIGGECLPCKRTTSATDPPHVMVTDMTPSTLVAFVTPDTMSFTLKVQRSDVSTTKNMEFILRSRHRVFQRNEEIPAINVVGLGSNSNCVVTSISTTERELHIQLEPIVSTAPCLLSNGHILSLELVQSECGQCLAPNPRSNQHVRIVSVWKGTSPINIISSTSCPTTWYQTRPSTACASQDGSDSHLDRLIENEGYKRRIDLTCDVNNLNQCDITTSKYVASDKTIITTNYPRLNKDGLLTNLFDQSITTSSFSPKNSYWRGSSKMTTIQIVFTRPRRIAEIKYRPRVSTSAGEISVQVRLQEAYLFRPDGFKLENIMLDPYRNDHCDFQKMVSLSIPSKDWTQVYGKRPLWVKIIEIDFQHGMDEIEIWELVTGATLTGRTTTATTTTTTTTTTTKSDDGLSLENDYCACGGNMTSGVGPFHRCKRDEYCLGEVNKCMPRTLPTKIPTWLGEENCGCGIASFFNFCSQCDHYRCVGTCTWPMCHDTDDIVLQSPAKTKQGEGAANSEIFTAPVMNYDHPCRCSDYSPWSIATPTHLAQLTSDNDRVSFQYLLTTGTSYWMSPTTTLLWDWTTSSVLHGTWKYSRLGWDNSQKSINEQRNDARDRCPTGYYFSHQGSWANAASDAVYGNSKVSGRTNQQCADRCTSLGSECIGWSNDNVGTASAGCYVYSSLSDQNSIFVSANDMACLKGDYGTKIMESFDCLADSSLPWPTCPTCLGNKQLFRAKTSTGGNVGFGCVLESPVYGVGKYVRPKTINATKTTEGKILLEATWSTESTGVFGFVDRKDREAIVYVRTEKSNPVCMSKHQCTIGSSSASSAAPPTGTCSLICVVNRLLEKSCTCGSTTCQAGERCTTDNTCVPECRDGHWESGELCACGGDGTPGSATTTCGTGEACHQLTGTCVVVSCSVSDGRSATEDMCVCATPTHAEVCDVGQYCVSGTGQKPCQTKCDGVLTPSLTCLHDKTKLYQARTKRMVDMWGRETERDDRE